MRRAKRYRAFISYHHSDRKWAFRLHRALERYRLPRDLVGVDKRRGLGRFFLDDQELAGGHSLDAAIEGAIVESQSLIVIASPAAARSGWVDDEVRRFKRRDDPSVFALILRGRADVNDPANDCFPPTLRVRVNSEGEATGAPDEPSAPDLTKESFRRAFTRLVAGLVGIPFDSLWRREQRRRRWRWTVGGVSALGIALSGIALAGDTLVRMDRSSLVAFSRDRSREGWFYYREDDFFGQAFRAAVASSRLPRLLGPQPNGDLRRCDLDATVLDDICAIGLSGGAFSSVRVFGDEAALTRGNVRLDIEGADLSRRLAVHASAHVRSLSFSSDSRRLGMVDSHGNGRIFDIEAGQVLFDWSIPGTPTIDHHIAVNESGSLSVVSDGPTLYEIDAKELSVYPLVDLDVDHTTDLYATAQGWLAMGVRGGEAVASVVERRSGDTTTTLLRGMDRFSTYTLTSDQEALLAYDDSQGLIRVDLAEGVVSLVKVPGAGAGVGEVKAIAIGSENRWAVLGGNGSDSGLRMSAQLISLDRLEETGRLVGHTGEVYAAHVAAGQGFIVTAGSDFTTRIWSLESGHEIARLGSHKGPVYFSALSPDLRWLATASSDGMVLLWNLTGLAKDPGARAAVPYCDSIMPTTGSRATVLTEVERLALPAYHGRPWDICEWEPRRSVVGLTQFVRAVLVRSLRLSVLDYSAED